MWDVGSSRTRARTCVPCIGRRILNHCATGEALRVHSWLNGRTSKGLKLHNDVILLNWLLRSGRNDTLIRRVKTGSKFAFTQLFKCGDKLTGPANWEMPLEPPLTLYNCSYFHIHLMVCVYIYVYVYTFFFFEKVVFEVLLVVTFQQHKRVYDESNLAPTADLQRPPSETTVVYSLMYVPSTHFHAHASIRMYAYPFLLYR